MLFAGMLHESRFYRHQDSEALTDTEDESLNDLGPSRRRYLWISLGVFSLFGSFLLICSWNVYGSAHAAHRVTADLNSIVGLINWDLQTKFPPWLSPITEGSSQGVAIVLGQSLKPDGKAPLVLLDRAKMAKTLLDEGKVTKVIVSGGDPAGVGHTEASTLAKVLEDAGIPSDKIILESQATTTAENIWFALRWMPKGTGQLYIVTSDFHVARATYIFEEVLNFFYKMIEDAYRFDSRWKSETKRYPRLQVIQVPTKSFCGSNASLNRDDDPDADVNTKSLAFRAMSELGYLGTKEVPNSLYGAPLSDIMYIWPVQIDVHKDPENADNFNAAMAQSMNVVRSLCKCKAPPEGEGPQLPYPLHFPMSTISSHPIRSWGHINVECAWGAEGILFSKSR